MKHSLTGSFDARARELYRRAGPRVDPATAAHLRNTRRAAVKNNTHRRLPWMVPAGACAVALLAAVVVWQPLQRAGTVATIAPAVSSNADVSQVLPPDAGEVDPALYQHLDFYAWLARHPAKRHQHASGH